MTGLALFSILGLIILYLTRPFYRPILISAAHFFRVRETTTSTRRFSLRSILFSRAFWVQLAVLVLILMALLWLDAVRQGSRIERVGVWILADTSASMTTQQSDGSHYDRLIKELQTLTETLSTIPPDTPICVQVWGFDMVLRPLSEPLTLSNLMNVAPDLRPRPLGTDLGLVTQLLQQAISPEATAQRDLCPPTHLVVLSDQPAQSALVDEVDFPVIWRSFGTPIDNFGIIGVTYADNPVFGGQRGIEVEIGAWYGDKPVTVRLEDSLGNINEQTVRFEGVSSRTVTFTDLIAGQTRLLIEPGGAYAFDDEIRFILPNQSAIRVDWQIASDYDIGRFGWELTTNSPSLRIQSWRSPLLEDDIPTLLIGEGYGGQRILIDRFIDNSPLLANLSLDVAEQLGVIGVSLLPESALQPILMGEDNGVLFAQSTTPSRVLIPGLPQGNPDEPLYNFSTTSFYNAVAWLLQNYQPPALYTLTSPANPEPDIGHMVLHAGEGDSTLSPSDIGQFVDIGISNRPEPEPIWPIFVLLSFCLFALERALAVLRGDTWY